MLLVSLFAPSLPLYTFFFICFFFYSFSSSFLFSLLLYSMLLQYIFPPICHHLLPAFSPHLLIFQTFASFWQIFIRNEDQLESLQQQQHTDLQQQHPNLLQTTHTHKHRGRARIAEFTPELLMLRLNWWTQLINCILDWLID